MSYSTYRNEDQPAPSQLLEDLVLLGRALGSAFHTLNRIRFEAPWNDTGYRR